MLILILVASAGVTVKADVLYLRDGTRYTGELVSQSEASVVFRVSTGADGATMVRSFPRDQVRAVERRPRDDDSPAASGDIRRYEIPEPSPQGVEPQLQAILALLDRREFDRALRTLQDLVVGSEDETRAAADTELRSERRCGLAELLARLRFATAIDGPPQRLFEMRFATNYERAALGLILADAQSLLLTESFRGRSVLEWAEAPEEYAKLTLESRELANAARLASAMIGARLQFDPALTRQREERLPLIGIREKLERLIGHVTKMKGYTTIPATDMRGRPTPRSLQRRHALLQLVGLSDAQTEAAARDATATSRPARRDSLGGSLFGDDGENP